MSHVECCTFLSIKCFEFGHWVWTWLKVNLILATMRYAFGYWIFTMRLETMLTNYWENGQLSTWVQSNHFFYKKNLWWSKRDKHIKTRGVSHCGLATYIKKYLNAKKRIMETQIFHHAKKNLPKHPLLGALFSKVVTVSLARYVLYFS